MSKGHIFLVGCERSGTTLLQSLLATQPAITSFPESHFFTRSIKTRRDHYLVCWGIRPPGMPQRLCAVARQIGDNEQQVRLPPCQIWLQAYIAAFVRLLDTHTAKQRKMHWLEKTPKHLCYIDVIERYIKDAKFIHLVRNGRDVVASLYAATNQYPAQWGGKQSLDQCIAAWKKAIQLTSRHLAKPNHFLVRYEALVADPPAILQQTCSFIGTPFQPDLLRSYPQQAELLILPFESWKAGVKQPITNRNGSRFYQIFDKGERAYIGQALLEVEPLLEYL